MVSHQGRTPNSERPFEAAVSRFCSSSQSALHATAIGHQIASTKLRNVRLRGRSLICATAKAQMVAVEMTCNLLDFDAPSLCVKELPCSTWHALPWAKHEWTPTLSITLSDVVRRDVVQPPSWPSAGQCLSEKWQACVHAVVNTCMVVGKFLVAMFDVQLPQPANEAASAIQKVELIFLATVDVESLQTTEIVRLRLESNHWVMPQPILPAVPNQLAGVKRDWQPDPKELRRIWIVTGSHRQVH